jgi:mono/diheme cytochrome c family protein
MLVSFVVLAFTVPLGIVALPFVEFFNGMAAQPKARTQMLIGRTYAQQQLVERQPVFGTMPRGYVPYAYDDRGNKIEDAKDVGLRLANPVPINMQNLRRGQKLYNVACINCHGEQGIGDGPVTGPSASPAGGRFPAPPSLHTDEARGYEDGTIFHIITKGVGKMPSHANDLAPADRWKVVHYVRALQRSMNPKPEDLRK